MGCFCVFSFYGVGYDYDFYDYCFFMRVFFWMIMCRVFIFGVFFSNIGGG